MAYHFRQSMCNEAFAGWSLAATCGAIRRAGYQGIEIAPFTLADDPASIAPGMRREYRSIILSEGLRFAGLHWLLAAPKGLHVTTPDAALRRRSWLHVHHLIDLCADLGEDGVLVFGSPRERSATAGLTPQQATAHFVEGLAGLAPHATQRGVRVLVEALPRNQCDVVLTLQEAAGIVERIGSPAIQTMFDSHNAVDETEPHAVLVDRYFDLIHHVHINETDGRHPGTGDYDFQPVFDVLRRRNYQGWVSLEAFDFTPGPEKVANDSLRYVESVIGKLPQ